LSELAVGPRRPGAATVTPAAGLLGDLGVPEGGDASQLNSVREAVVTALVGGQRETMHAGVGGGTFADAGQATPGMIEVEEWLDIGE
jgi:hypothetical protein